MWRFLSHQQLSVARSLEEVVHPAPVFPTKWLGECGFLHDAMSSPHTRRLTCSVAGQPRRFAVWFCGESSDQENKTTPRRGQSARVSAVPDACPLALYAREHRIPSFCPMARVSRRRRQRAAAEYPFLAAMAGFVEMLDELGAGSNRRRGDLRVENWGRGGSLGTTGYRAGVGIVLRPADLARLDNLQRTRQRPHMNSPLIWPNTAARRRRAPRRGRARHPVGALAQFRGGRWVLWSPTR